MGGKPVAGATSKFYRLMARDAGKRVTVAVTGSAPGATSVTRIASFPGSIVQYGSIAGTVYQPGTPPRTVANGSVTLWPAFSNGDEFTEPIAYADIVDGTYSFTEIPPGSYTLEFLDSATDQRAFLGGGNLRSGSTALVVTSDRQTTKNFTFSATGSISGTVVLNGPPAAPGAHLQVKAISAKGIGYAAAASDGSFTITGLPGGSYTVSVTVFDSPPYSFGQYTVGNGTVIGHASVAAGRTATGVKIVVKPAPVLSGTVTSQRTGLAVPSASVQVYRVGGENNGFITSATTRADGRFALPPLLAGTYKVVVVPQAGTGLALAYVGGASEATARTITVRDGDVSSELAAVALPDEAVLTGVVIAGETGLPLTGDFILYPGDDTLGVVPTTYARTDADGRFRVGGLPAGRYEFQVSATGDYPTQIWGQGTPGGPKFITLTAGQTTDIRVVALK